MVAAISMGLAHGQAAHRLAQARPGLLGVEAVGRDAWGDGILAAEV